MNWKTVDIHDAETRVERRERILIAPAGKPIAEIRPARKVEKRSRPLDDPLLHVDEYSYDGPIVTTCDEDIDRTVYT